MGSRRLCVQYRLQAAWRFDLGDPSEASVLNYYPVKGVTPISNLQFVKFDCTSPESPILL